VDVEQGRIITSTDCGTPTAPTSNTLSKPGRSEPCATAGGRVSLKASRTSRGQRNLDVKQEIQRLATQSKQRGIEARSHPPPCSLANRAAVFAPSATGDNSLGSIELGRSPFWRHRESVHRRTRQRSSHAQFHIGGAATRVSDFTHHHFFFILLSFRPPLTPQFR